MKNFILLFLIFFSTDFTIAQNNLSSSESEKLILQIVIKNLREKQKHDLNFDDDFSKKIFSQFLGSLDMYGLFLLQADIDELKKYELNLDDQIKNSDFSFLNEAFKIYKERMTETNDDFNNIIKNGFDFSINEEINRPNTLFRSKNPVSILNKQERFTNGRKFLKSIILSNTKNKFLYNSSHTKQDFDRILNEETLQILKSIEISNLAIQNLKRDNFFESYINSLLIVIDKQSKFFTPENKTKFLYNKNGKLEGVGLTFEPLDGFSKIKKITEGGPAWKTKQFDVGDAILKIAPDGKIFQNVASLNFFEVSKLTRGKAGTPIKIVIKKENGTVTEVAFKREVVALNDYFVKSCIVKKNKINYGVISITNFYDDIDSENTKNAIQDFMNEIKNLKKENIQGLVIDFRDNNSGNLSEISKFLQCFISEKPILYAKKHNDSLQKVYTNKEETFSKKTVLIINNKTGGGAEIIASVFKEFQLGILVGSATVGNGSTTDFLDLNYANAAQEQNQIGGLILTTTTYLDLSKKRIATAGVKPKIDFYLQNSSENKSRTNLNTNSRIILPDRRLILKRSFDRISNSTNFQKSKKISQQIIESTTQIENIETLNADKYFVILEKEFNTSINQQRPIIDESIIYSFTEDGVNEIKSKPYLKSSREKWLWYMKNDFQVDESINILEDYSKSK